MQKVDPARTLAAKLAPKLEADRLIGLYAFQYEIARVSESVSEPMLGAIRLQWWREAVDEIRVGKPVRAHDTAQALEDALAPIKVTYPLSLLDEMIDARERDLDETPFETIPSLNDYAAATAGTLTLAAASALAQDPIAETIQVGLRNAGRAWGLAGLARETAIAQQFDARNSNVNSVNFLLLNGDVDGDNEVGINDYALFGNAYGRVFGEAGRARAHPILGL